MCILCVIYSHSRNVFPGEGIGGVADEETCFTHSSERNKQTNTAKGKDYEQEIMIKGGVIFKSQNRNSAAFQLLSESLFKRFSFSERLRYV